MAGKKQSNEHYLFIMKKNPQKFLHGFYSTDER